MEQALSALRVQVRVVRALLLREILTRYGRHNIGFLWLFVEPMIFTLGVAALWSFARFHEHSTIPVVAFAVTGYSSVLLWRNMPTRCIGAVDPNLALMSHRQVKVIDIFLSRLILEAMGATISFIVLSLVFISIGWMRMPHDVLKIAQAWFMLAWFGMALAIFLGSLSIRSELVEKLWHPAAYLLFPLSGAAFMVDWLPPAVRKVVLLLPMVHGVECLREGYFGPAVSSHYDLAYMGVFSLALTAVALAQERVASKQVVPG